MLLIGKNDPLPVKYIDEPYQYINIGFCVILKKADKEKWLYCDDETQFFRECNRAKQKGRSISDVIAEYFIN